jgi:endoglucanase
MRARLLVPTLTAAAALICGAAVTAGHAATPAATASPDAGTGYWHTSGNKILDSAGGQVRIAGINWYGFETPDMVAHGLWSVDYKVVVDDIRQLGYNTIRIPFSNQMVESPVVPQNIGYYGNGGPINTDLQGLNSLQILDKIITYAGQDGLKVILDDHRSEAGESAEQNGLWYTSAYPQSAWVNDWVTLARRYANNPTVIGADLRNEPHTPTGVAYANGATWGTGDTGTDFRLACQTAGNAVLAVQPNWLIMVEGIGEFQNANGTIDSTWWGGDLQGVATFPVQLNVANRVVYSPHDYGPDEFQQTWFTSSTTYASLAAVWDKFWGYLSSQNTAPIWVGEFGVPNSDAGTTAAGSEGQWFASLIQYIRATPAMGWTYWALNGEDRYGLLDGSYSISTASATKQALLASIQFPLTGTSTSPSASPTPTGTGTGAPPGGGCAAAYQVTNSWPTGFTATVAVTNEGAAIGSWTVTFTLPAGEAVTNLWSGTYTQSGSTVTVRDAGYDGSVPAGGTASFGFQAGDSGTPGTAGNFTLNGGTCT